MKILLVQPDYNKISFKLKGFWFTEPLSLETIASYLYDHDIYILDLRMGGDIQRIIEDFQPDIVGVTCLTTEVYEAKKILKTAKTINPEIWTIVGGHHATIMSSDFYEDYIDLIVVGVGGKTVKKIVHCIKNNRSFEDIDNIIFNFKSEWRKNKVKYDYSCLDDNYSPIRTLVERRNEYKIFPLTNIASISTAHGCPYKCSFCSVWEFYQGIYNAKSPEKVLSELEKIENMNIIFVDDNFFVNPKRSEKISLLIRNSDIKKEAFIIQVRSDSVVKNPKLIEKWCGLGKLWVFLGVESLSDQRLKRYNKMTNSDHNTEAINILKQNGTIPFTSFIVDVDFEEDDFDALYNYVVSMKIPAGQFVILTPLPGTRMFYERYNELTTTDYRYFDLLHAVLPTKLPIETFYKRFAKLYKSFFEVDDNLNYFAGINFGKEDFMEFKANIKKLTNYENYLSI